MATRDELVRYRFNRQEEVDSAFQYRAMARGERDPSLSRIYVALAETEEKHAAFWEERLRQAGGRVEPARPSWRARTLAFIATHLGAGLVLPTVASREYVGRNGYRTQAEAAGTSMPAQEHTHARVLQTLVRRKSGAEGSLLGRIEGRHRTIGGNALRAAVLGANDGLCSNLSLVMGVAGAAVDAQALRVAGLAGLLAGAFSMALGEWVSVQSSRELAERELRIEADELLAAPEDEREELQLIYEAKGLGPEEAKKLSTELMRDPTTALDVLGREELGLNPDELEGAPWVAAFTSFFLFASGAILPVLPFFFLQGSTAVWASLGVSGAGLLGIGTGISLFTGRSVWRTALRQLLFGLAAAGITFALGRLLGAAITA
jgi:VIT1/CCC1 family predicted Fe2+/Mn2+ transporter